MYSNSNKWCLCLSLVCCVIELVFKTSFFPKPTFPHLIGLGFGFEVRLSSYRRRWSWDIRRPVDVWVGKNWLGTFLLYAFLRKMLKVKMVHSVMFIDIWSIPSHSNSSNELNLKEFYNKSITLIWTVINLKEITCGAPEPVGSLGGGGWGACWGLGEGGCCCGWPPRNAWSRDTWGWVDSGAGTGGMVVDHEEILGKAYHRATRGPSEPLGSEASSSEVARSGSLWRCHSRGHEKNPWPELMENSERPCGHLILILVLTSDGV